MADFQLQSNKKKTLYYITYRTKRDDGRYKKNYLHHEDGSIVSFDTLAKAEKYRTSLRVKEDAKYNLQATRDRMSRKYGNHEDYLTTFLKQKKKDTSKSYQRSEWHLVHYIYPFFIHEKKEKNTGLWASYFEEFKEWLEEEATTIRKNKHIGNSKLSISSRNKIIGDLNSYLSHLFKKRHLLIPPPKCDYIDGAEDGYRTAEDIVDDEIEYPLVLEEFDKMILDKEMDRNKISITKEKREFYTKQLTQIKETKLLYIVCRRTGMRISEALGLSFGDFYPRKMTDRNLNKLLEKNELTSLSYIILKSQLGGYDKTALRWNREPLKTKRNKELENARTIPIFNGQEDCHAILSACHVETRQHYAITTPAQIKQNEGQYLFFRNITKNIATSNLRKIYDKIDAQGFKWKSFHCLRHSRSNELISLTHDQTLVKLIIGHKSRVYERYVHLEGTLAKKLTKDQESVLLDFNLDEPAVV